jgi:hypothetical protein
VLFLLEPDSLNWVVLLVAMAIFLIWGVIADARRARRKKL